MGGKERDLISPRNEKIRFWLMNISWCCRPAGCQPSYSVEVLECAHEAGLGGRGERTKRSRIQVPDDINCGLIARLTSVSVLCGLWPSSRSYFRSRIRAEMAHNHRSWTLQLRPKLPKLHTSDQLQEMTHNMMTFPIKWYEREMI